MGRRGARSGAPNRGRPGCRPPPRPTGWESCGLRVWDVRQERPPRRGESRAAFGPGRPPTRRGRPRLGLGQGRAAAGGVSAAGGLNRSVSQCRGLSHGEGGQQKPGGLCPLGRSRVLLGAIHRAGRETCAVPGSPAASWPPCLAPLVPWLIFGGREGSGRGSLRYVSPMEAVRGAAGRESCGEPRLPAHPGDALSWFHTCRRRGKLQRFNGEN